MSPRIDPSFRPERSAVSLRDALQRGEVSARSAVEESLERIAAHRDLGSFITVTADAAIADAEAADRRIAEHLSNPDVPLPRLIGMPIAHKDLVDVADVQTTYGSAAVPHAVAEHDDPGVATLRAAGTVSLGKTQVPEFGLNAYSENLIAEPARNPLDPSLTTGGSSGGSAAAVRTGALPVAPGSDGGGSIRIPSFACGLVGLKPGLGTIASDVLQGETDAFGGPRLAVSGPIAHTAEDAALLFDAMIGRSDEPTLAAVRAFDRVAGLKIGISTVSPFASAFEISLDPSALAAFEVAAARLAEVHRVEQAEITYDPAYADVFDVAWTSSLGLLELEPGAEHRLTSLTRAYRERALSRSDEVKHEAGVRMQEIARSMREQWGAYDVVLTPGLGILPPTVGTFMALSPDDDFQLQCRFAPFTSMVNVAGLPAIAVPITTLPSGLSVGVQLIGRRGSEAQLLQLAAQLMAQLTAQ